MNKQNYIKLLIPQLGTQRSLQIIQMFLDTDLPKEKKLDEIILKMEFEIQAVDQLLEEL